MIEGDRYKPEDYSLGDRVIFSCVRAGEWIASQTEPDRPLEVINKTESKINFWDWEPHKLVRNFVMTREEFDGGNYARLVIRG